MFDKLIEFFLNILDLFRFWIVVQAGTRTVVYTLGVPTRILAHDNGIKGSGLHPKFPFWIEIEVETSIREEIVPLMNQSLTTSDKHNVHVTGSFQLKIDPEKVIVWQTLLGDEDKAVGAGLRAAIADTVTRRPLDDLLDPEEIKGIRQEVIMRARKILVPYGYKIMDFWWTERCAPKMYRFITGE